MGFKTYEQKLVEVLDKSLSEEVTPIEYTVNNAPSETEGKIKQTVSFVYEMDEPTEKNADQK